MIKPAAAHKFYCEQCKTNHAGPLECDACGEWFNTGEYEDGSAKVGKHKPFKFCPNCGQSATQRTIVVSEARP
jgi:hypothetical protein